MKMPVRADLHVVYAKDRESQGGKNSECNLACTKVIHILELNFSHTRDSGKKDGNSSTRTLIVETMMSVILATAPHARRSHPHFVIVDALPKLRHLETLCWTNHSLRPHDSWQVEQVSVATSK